MEAASDARGSRVPDRHVNVPKDARGRDGSAEGATRLDPMPRIPRLRRGEEDVPPEARAEEQSQQDTRQLTSGDPLATPAPAPAADPAASLPHAVTSGDPLAGPGAPAATPPPAAPPAVEQPTVATPAVEQHTEVLATPAAPAVTPPEGGAAAQPLPGAVSADATQVLPPASTSAVVAAPAGPEEAATVVETAPVDARPGFRERTRMRRRMRELRRLREISFRDLGGLSFDLHRFGRDRPDLVTEKLESLRRIDAELRVIEDALDARRPLVELREPGIAACPRCGTLHGTDANFCPGCGTPLRGSVVHEAGPLRVTPVEQPQPQPQAETQPQPPQPDQQPASPS